jgi:two-component system phosphate regulon response regulator OmpR
MRPVNEVAERVIRILVVDDDDRLRTLIERHLEQAGFYVRGVPDAKQMTRLIEREHFDLIVLDLMLPDEDGLEVCARLRREGVETPVLMLTAKGDDHDRVTGLEVGADDYLAKPCNARELVARIRAILRRSRLPPPGTPDVAAEIVQFGEFSFDLAHRRLQKKGEEIPLTSGDFALLSALVKNAGQSLSRERLQALVSGREYTPLDRSIDVRVARMRRLIEDDVTKPRHIQTVWGFGYVMVLNP